MSKMCNGPSRLQLGNYECRGSKGIWTVEEISRSETVVSVKYWLGYTGVIAKPPAR